MYSPKVPEYAAKIYLIRSFFSDFSCNCVRVAGFVFLFPFLLTLKSSAQHKQKHETSAVILFFFL